MKYRIALTLLTFASTALAQQDAFDRIQQAYAPYLKREDPLSLAMKIKSLSSDEYKFWRGSKDLFFQWSRQNCHDWFTDEKNFLPNHGDLHLGNIGTYVTEDGMGKMGFGMVDFDDAARLPFEMELLQGLITLDLIARQNKITMGAEQISALDRAMFDSYRIAVNSRRNAGDLLRDDPTVKVLLAKAEKKTYADELEKFTQNGRFRPLIRKKQKVTDILDEVDPSQYPDFSEAIVKAIANDSRLRDFMPEVDLKTIRAKVRHVVRRTRVDSSGSQGLAKYLILMDKPFKDVDHDIILYVKQQIPTAAERSGVIAPDTQNPAKRCAEYMDQLTEPRACINSWTMLQGKSFWVHFKEPWSDEIEYDDIKDLPQLMRMAQLWGTVVGAMHRDENRFQTLLPQLTPDLLNLIRQRASAYQLYQQQAFNTFQSDPRTKTFISDADKEIEARIKK